MQSSSTAASETGSEQSWIRQGYLLPPTLFSIFLERIMGDALEDNESTVNTEGRTAISLCFAYDIDGLAGEEEGLAK